MHNPGIALPGPSLLTLSSVEVSWLMFVLAPSSLFSIRNVFHRLPGWGENVICCIVFSLGVFV